MVYKNHNLALGEMSISDSGAIVCIFVAVLELITSWINGLNLQYLNDIMTSSIVMYLEPKTPK